MQLSLQPCVTFDPKQRLEPWPAPPSEKLESGRPEQAGHVYFEDKTLGLSAGLWQSTAFTGKLRPQQLDEFCWVIEGEAEIVLADGSQHRFEANRGFVLPKGLLCQWRIPRFAKKAFFSLEDATPQSPLPRLTVIDPTLPLEDQGSVSSDLLYSGSPSPRFAGREFFRDASGRLEIGVWSATAFHRQPVAFKRQELMIALEGSVSLASPEGARQLFKTGDLFFLANGTMADFKVEDRVKKIYVIYHL